MSENMSENIGCEERYEEKYLRRIVASIVSVLKIWDAQRFVEYFVNNTIYSDLIDFEKETREICKKNICLDKTQIIRVIKEHCQPQIRDTDKDLAIDAITQELIEHKIEIIK